MRYRPGHCCNVSAQNGRSSFASQGAVWRAVVLVLLTELGRPVENVQTA